MACFLCGTPSILAMSALDAALDVFDGVSLTDIRCKSRRMTDAFIELFDARLAPWGFRLCCERNGGRRGSHIAFSHPDGCAIMQALATKGIIGDYRPPDILRFGFAPLCNRYVDVYALVTTIATMTQQRA